MGQRAEREDVGGADERGQPERDPPAQGMLVLELMWRGDDMPISSAPSRPGTSQVGPTVSRLGSSSCSAIAARIVAWAGQNGSAAAGGG